MKIGALVLSIIGLAFGLVWSMFLIIPNLIEWDDRVILQIILLFLEIAAGIIAIIESVLKQRHKTLNILTLIFGIVLICFGSMAAGVFFTIAGVLLIAGTRKLHIS
jgi:hypothetical protein